jgi:Leucine rich repeat
VRNLDLSHNKIKRLSKTSFNKVSNIETLDLSHNELDNIADDTFTILKKIKKLLLGHNQLQKFDFDWVKSVTKLQTLQLQQNQIATIVSIYPNKKITIEDVNLNDNKIVSIWALHSSCLNIKTLQLSNNINLTLDMSVVLKQFETSLETLSLDGINHYRDITAQLEQFNKLTKLGIGQVGAFRSHKTLNQIILRGNNIQLCGYENLNRMNFPNLTVLKMPSYNNTVNCTTLINLAKHLQLHDINFEVNNQEIKGTDLAIAQNLDCQLHDISFEVINQEIKGTDLAIAQKLDCHCYQTLAWTVVTILTFVSIIINVVLFRKCLGLRKKLASREVQQYQSPQLPVDINPIYAANFSY